MSTKVNLKTATLESMGIQSGKSLMDQRGKLTQKGLLPYKVARDINVSPNQPLSSKDIAKQVSQNSSGPLFGGHGPPGNNREARESARCSDQNGCKTHEGKVPFGLVEARREGFAARIGT